MPSHDVPKTPPNAIETADYTPLVLNPVDYCEDMAEFNLTQEQETELLTILWEIAATFAMMGFGMEATQLALNSVFKNVAPDSEGAVTIELIKEDSTEKEENSE